MKKHTPLLFHLWLLLFLSCFTNTASFGQLPSNYQAYQVPISGFLANSSIHKVYQDHIGLLWIGTEDGLFVFDGNVVERFYLEYLSLSNSTVFSIVEDDQNRLWVSTQQGGFVLNVTRDKAIEYNQLGIPDTLLQQNNLRICQGPNKSLFILSRSQIYLWQGDELGVWKVLPSQLLHTFTKHEIIYSQRDQSLIINASMLHNTIYVLSKNEDIIELETKHSLVFSKIDRDSILAFRGYTLQFDHYDYFSKDTKLSIQQEEIDYQFIAPVKKLLANEQNVNLDHLGGWQIYPLKEGNWVVSCNVGLFLVSTHQKIFKNIPSSRKQKIRGIAKDSYNHLIYGTYDGLYYFNFNSSESKRLMNKVPTIWSIVATDTARTTFLATGEGRPKGICFLRSTPQSIILDSLLFFPRNKTGSKDIIQDNGGRGFWVFHAGRTSSYLSFITKESYKSYRIYPSIETADVRSMVQTDGIWLGTDQGLKYLDISALDNNRITVRNEVIPVELLNCYINVVETDANNNLWIGTKGQGVFYYKTDTKDLIQYTTMNGLADNTVFSIILTPEDIVWLGTGDGLSRLDLKKNKFENYYVKDGLLGNEFNTGAAYLDTDGTIYIGGQNGINYFDPADFKTDTTFSSNYLTTRIKDGSSNSAPHNVYLTSHSTLQIESSVTLLELSFHSDNIIQHQTSLFRYRISNLDQEWNYLNPTDKALLTRLPKGKHTLELQSQSRRGTWTPTTSYFLNVLPPWHQTWWFRILATLSIISTLYLLHLLKIRQLRKEFSLRQQISHDLHDSLGSRMFLLRNLSNHIANPLLPEKEKQVSLQKLKNISQDIFKTTRNFIWAFDPKEDGIMRLFEFMEDFAENYISPIVKEFSIDYPQTKSFQKITPRNKHHLINIYQELLNNMIKHTNSYAIQIQMSFENGIIHVNIKNSHVGFQNSNKKKLAQSSEIGLESIRNRLELINASIDWKEPTPNEQWITLSVPI